MVALSIVLPEEMAKASQKVAKQLHLSRAQFIRRAISHELQHFQKKLEQEAMANSVQAMKDSVDYLQDIEEIESQLNTSLLENEQTWWNNKIP
jgi:metal-responsive CopG/Arc/MetJ family transcriptional regulator